MKKTLALAAVLFIGAAAFSQDTSVTRPMGGDSMQHGNMMKHKMKDCVMMKDGAPVVMKGGQTIPLDQQMTLPNGTVIMTDGTIKMKNGTTKTLKEGESIYMDGTIGRMPMRNKNKMMKDSTMM